MNQVQTSGNEVDKTRTQGKFKLFHMDNFLISLKKTKLQEGFEYVTRIGNV